MMQQHTVIVSHITENGLTELPEFIGNFINLEVLDVGGMIDAAAHTVIVSHITANKLKHLPESIAQLKNLKWLNVSGMIDAAAHTVHTAAGGDV